MSHHLSGPNLRSPREDARLDMTDLYAFSAPVGRTVLILDVHPLATADSAAFHPDAVYRINVDTDGDHRADVAFSFTFTDPAAGPQTMTVHRADGAAAQDHEAGGTVLATGVPVTLGAEDQPVEAGPYRVAVGLRSDPFFADLDGIVNGFTWTGVDWGADKNVLGIVLELPDAELAPGTELGLWGRVSLREGGRLVSVDRGAHPSLTAYFNAEEVKDAYNAGEPADDWATYREPWIAALEHLGGYTGDAAEAQLRIVLPDVLHYDRSRPAGYPNGRTLTDDVTSTRLSMITNGAVPTDHIGPHTDLLPHFPYLGRPH
ncbi:hypothetical protein GCM10010441_41470 [Kitasatospora paracochleata]|uniref:DUF4331 domain-containing protein n=1 Tax=Kitasatospora paracochleata TaxID=58354 RepID=A0ABT1J4P8_9ACTN|nr:DUF4331 family protein [Kitasatospora paracochleata]MCP2312411.1 hypothetical protein [Kitasatospora paracochleata]